MSQLNMQRRGFLKLLGAAAATVGFPASATAPALPELVPAGPVESISVRRYATLIPVSRELMEDWSPSLRTILERRMYEAAQLDGLTGAARRKRELELGLGLGHLTPTPRLPA